jgi:hypothetical protein
MVPSHAGCLVPRKNSADTLEREEHLQTICYEKLQNAQNLNEFSNSYQGNLISICVDPV